MIHAVLDKLNNSNNLKTLLGAAEDNPKIYPISADIKDIPCITYNDSPVSDDGLLKVNRLEIRAIDNDYDHLQEVIKTVSGLLIIPENKPGYIFKDVNIMSCQQNGGGSLEDVTNGIYEKFIYLNIEWRNV